MRVKSCGSEGCRSRRARRYRIVVRRRLPTVAVFLLAGAVVNVAVAWGCALWSNVSGPLSFRSQRLEISWKLEPLTRAPHTWTSEASGFGYTKFITTTALVADTGDARRWTFRNVRPTMVSAEAGWPVRCLRGVRPALGLPVPWSWLKPKPGRQLMLDPIWPGFAFNTLFYAAILWLAIPGPFALRRLIRRRRGLCPACGYDLRHGEHKACPECGGAA